MDDLKWGLMEVRADRPVIVYMYAEFGRNQCTAKQINSQDAPNPSKFITTPFAGKTGQYITAANNAVWIHNPWVINKQCQIFAPAVWLGQNTVPSTLLMTTGPSSYNNRVSNISQLLGVAQRKVLHGLTGGPNVPTSIQYCILECGEYHMTQLRKQGNNLLSDVQDKQ